uniref:Cell cycle control protein n=1 Tax=Cyprinodon variegatus TaxID=28743 RepID=A0A3Q2E6S5_CYPVA
MVKNEPEKSSDRPDNTAFTQQRLPAWQPILSAGIVIPGFVLIGLAFIGVGVALFITSRDIQVLELDYTGVESSNPCSKCTDPNVRKCICTIVFSLDTLFKGPVFMYYGLTNYFQNQRRYGVSRDDNQLAVLHYRADCAPFDYDSNDRPIVPCGALANSMFNGMPIYTSDTTVKSVSSKKILSTPHTIANLHSPQVEVCRQKAAVISPWYAFPAVLDSVPGRAILKNRGTTTMDNYDERLIEEVLKYNPSKFSQKNMFLLYYKVFNGRKKVVLSNVSWMGGKNDFLGIAYLVVGSLCIVMSIVMLIVYAKFKFPEDD